MAHSAFWWRCGVRAAWIFLSLAMAVPIANAQNYRGQAVPVIERANAIEFSRMRFLTFVFGREGPMDAPLRTPPVSGHEYFVEADVFGIESAANVRFELVDISGRSLQTLTMWKASDGSSDGEFSGFVRVPSQPFRAVVTGVNRAGAPFRSTLDTLFQPVATGPAGPVDQFPPAVASYRQQLQSRAVQAAADHPNGVITLGRATVSRISYEPLNSSSGSPIGVRLRYSMQFPSRQTIVAMPHVFPVYQPWEWRGLVEMKALAGTITPAPENLGVQSLRDVVINRGAAVYQAGTTYSFTVDMVPDYIFQGIQTGRFCIHEQKVMNRTVWEAIKASKAPVPYSISISDTETFANIPAFFPQSAFYESFASNGAFDCGPVPNIRF